MRVSFDIFTSKYFGQESYVGNFKSDSIPTTSTPIMFDTLNGYYLTNTLEIKTTDQTYDGEYFVNLSVIYIDDTKGYPQIELYIEKKNEKQDTFLYLKGLAAYTVNEVFIPIVLKGQLEKKTKSLVVPRTNLDFISVDGIYYKCDNVSHKQNGTIEIFTSNGVNLESFRNSIIFPSA